MLSRRRYALSTAQNRSDFLARAWAGDTVDARVQEHVARVTLLGLAPVALYIVGVLARPADHTAPPWSLQHALLTPKLNPGSLYRCGKNTFKSSLSATAGGKGA